MTAGTHPAPNQRGLFWLILILLMLLAVLIIWLTVGFQFDRQVPDTDLVQIEPESGGLVIPAPTPIAASALDDLVLDGTVPEEIRDLVFIAGQPVVITNQATSGSAGQMPIFAEPSLDADIYNIYPSGTVLTVFEPPSEYGNYPLEIEGLSWVRVRDSSGLVGWTKAGMLYPIDAVEARVEVPILVQPQADDAPQEAAEGLETSVTPAASNSEAPAENIAQPTAPPQQEPTATSTPAG